MILTSEQARALTPSRTDFAMLGIAPGDRVCLVARNSPQLLVVVMGCLRAGIAPAILSASSTEREIAELSASIGAVAVLRDSDVMHVVSNVGDADAADGPLTCRPMHFTSGTSGTPKAVWSGWLSPEHASAWVAEETEAWGFTSADVHLVCGPMSHSAPLRFALMTLLNGGSVVIPSAFDPQVVANLLPQVTTTFMAPIHLQRLRDHVGAGDLDHSLRLLAHAGAPCPEPVRLWAHDVFGPDVVSEFYGSTEGQFTVCSAHEWQAHRGTVGRARPGRRLRVDNDGVLWCEVPEHARFTYWGDETQTAAAWDGSWFTVRDLGHIDDGYVFLDGRDGDLIITGGVNVYPAEIERVLLNLPGVDLCVAFGVSDPEWGERVCVAVVGSAADEDIITFMEANLAPAKRPKTLLRRPHFPLTHSGKVDRVRVRAECLASLVSPAANDVAMHILDSYRTYVGEELFERSGDAATDARRLFDLDAVVLSHDGGADPHFVYANTAAARLWRTTVEDLVGMPSQLSAPPDHRAERASTLTRAADQGFLHGYSGTRVARDGTLFVIEEATLWTVDYPGGPGQAVVFRNWRDN